jgi:transposase
MDIGVDTHKRSHTLVHLDATGQTVDTLTIANTPAAWGTALTWARRVATTRCWGIENSGSLGKGFAQFLLEQGEAEVREITPHRTAQYRRRGRTQDTMPWRWRASWWRSMGTCRRCSGTMPARSCGC